MPRGEAEESRGGAASAADAAEARPEELCAALSSEIAARPGLFLLTGDSRFAKTALLRDLSRQLRGGGHHVLLVRGDTLVIADLLLDLSLRAGIAPPGPDGIEAWLGRFHEATARASGGAAFIVMIDDAEAVGDETLAGLAALLLQPTGHAGALRLLLGGAPELAARLTSPALAALGPTLARHFRFARTAASEVDILAEFARQLGEALADRQRSEAAAEGEPALERSEAADQDEASIVEPPVPTAARSRPGPGPARLAAGLLLCVALLLSFPSRPGIDAVIRGEDAATTAAAPRPVEATPSPLPIAAMASATSADGDAQPPSGEAPAEGPSVAPPVRAEPAPLAAGGSAAPPAAIPAAPAAAEEQDRIASAAPEAAAAPPGAADEKTGGTERSASKPAIAPAAALPAELIALLERRGDALLDLRDIAGARPFFERAAMAGSARAATQVGKTYDPLFLHAAGVLGVQADPAQAVRWYRRAAELGDEEAKRRMAALGG